MRATKLVASRNANNITHIAQPRMYWVHTYESHNIITSQTENHNDDYRFQPSEYDTRVKTVTHANDHLSTQPINAITELK
jgi:hypothetical protein